jgi:hypothetical protein
MLVPWRPPVNARENIQGSDSADPSVGYGGKHAAPEPGGVRGWCL